MPTAKTGERDAWHEATERRIDALEERVIWIADALQVRKRGRLITARQGEGKAES
jgi:hypothetical protein